MSEKLVSVVVIFFDQEKFIGETLESVCRQTHDRLQIIVVDDGSRDAGYDLVQREFGSRVELFTQPNRGPSAALNAALRQARGDYVALLAGDDISAPHRIEAQADALDRGEYDIVFARPDLIDENGNALPRDAYEVFFRQIEPDQSIFASLLFDDNFLCAPSAMLRADVVQALGSFHEGLIQLQDYDYWLRAAGRGYRLGILDEPLIKYRRHSRNLSANSRDFATLTELPFVAGRGIDQALPEVLRQAFPHIVGMAVRQDAVLNPLDRLALLMAHPRAEVRALGMTRLMASMEEPGFKTWAQAQGLNLFQLLFNAGAGSNGGVDPLKLALRH